MKSKNYPLIALKSVLLFVACCLLYFLSTGPAMIFMLNIESDSVDETVQIYLTPLIEIEHVLSGQSNNDPLPEQSLFQKALVKYLEFYGEETALIYEIMYWKHSFTSGRVTPTGGCIF